MTSSENETARDLAARAAGAAAAVAHAGAGEAAGAGPPVRDGRGAAGRQRARPAEGRDPGVAAVAAGRARLLRHHRPGRARRPRARRLRVLHGQRGAGPRLDVRRPASWPARRASGTAVPDADRAARPAGAAAPAATGSARSRCPSPTPGSDLAGVSTRAVLDGDEWVVTGHKRWCGNAKAADFIQVLVRERDPERGRVPLGRPGQPAAGEEARRVPRGAVRLPDRQGRLPRLPHLGPRSSTASGSRRTT